MMSAITRCALMEYAVGLLSVGVSAWVWSTQPYYSWVPLMLYVGLIAAITGLLAPRRGWTWVILQIVIGGVVASNQVSTWLDPIATPPEGVRQPLGFNAKFFVASVTVGAICALISFTGVTWLYRRMAEERHGPDLP